MKLDQVRLIGDGGSPEHVVVRLAAELEFMSEDTAIRNAAFARLGKETIGKYQVRRVIAEGGFGTVFEGWDPHIKRRVAIKTCAVADAEIRKRFQQEAQIAGNLDHPYVVRIFDFGVENGLPYLVQEYLPGSDLGELISNEHYLTFPEKLLILLQIARGLAYAHGHGVIHRDIKPANVRILEDGSIKLMDFGIATLQNAANRLTHEGMTAGTAAYLAPEQVKGLPASERTDIFAYGVLAYELLSGRRPFDGDTISAVLFQIVNDRPPGLLALRTQAPPDLADLVHRCLDKDPGRRWPNVASLQGALERLRDGLPRAASADIPIPEESVSSRQREPGDLDEVRLDSTVPARDRSGRILLTPTQPRRPSLWPWAAVCLLGVAMILFLVGEVRGGLRLEDLITDLRSGRSQVTERAPEPEVNSGAPVVPLTKSDSAFEQTQFEDIGFERAVFENAGPNASVELEELKDATPESLVDLTTPPAEPNTLLPSPPATITLSGIWHSGLRLAIDGGSSQRLAKAVEQELEPGEHRLVFSLSTAGYSATHRLTVNLESGENRRIRCPILQPGSLTVQAAIGSRQGVVTINGRTIGKTPIRSLFLRPGDHSVSILLGSSVPPVTLTAHATLRSGEETIVTFDPRQTNGVLIHRRALDPAVGENSL